MTLPVLAFSISFIPTGLLWAFLAALNFWVWRRSKSTGHLLMLGGAGWLTLHYLVGTFDVCLFGGDRFGLVALIGSAVFATGFYLSVRSLVAEDLGKVRRLIASRLGKPGVAPTIPYAPASASAPASPPPSSPPPSVSPPPPPPTVFRPPSIAVRPPAPDDLNLR